MSWDKAAERSEKGGGGGSFVKLADHGDKIVVAFVGDPHFEDLVWNQKTQSYDAYNETHKAEGKSPTPRFKMNCYVPADKSMKVWEVNNSTFQDVLKVKTKYGLDKMFFEVERNGKKGDTKTTYSILPETAIDDEHKAIMAKLPLHDLTKTKDSGDASTDMNSHDKKKAEPAAAAPAAAPVSEFVSDEQNKALIERLKKLPRELLADFLSTFGVKQVKALKKSDFDAASKWIGTKEAPAAAPAAEAEVDPFA